MENKIELLKKPYWHCKDISQYLQIGMNKAYEIKRQVLIKEPNAQCLFHRNKISSDAVLRLMLHSSRENEMRLLHVHSV